MVGECLRGTLVDNLVATEENNNTSNTTSSKKFKLRKWSKRKQTKIKYSRLFIHYKKIMTTPEM